MEEEFSESEEEEEPSKTETVSQKKSALIPSKSEISAQLSENPWASTPPAQKKHTKTPEEMGFVQLKGKWVSQQGEKIYDQQGNELNPETLAPIE